MSDNRPTREECEAIIAGWPSYRQNSLIEIARAHLDSLDEIANLKRRMGLIGAACVAGDLYEAYHQFYMAVVKDLNLPAEEQSRLTQEAIDAAKESKEGEPK